MQKVWPDFFIVGAAKAGTTSLYEHLKGHAQVFMSPVKEPHFFANLPSEVERRPFTPWVTAEDDYCQLFRGAAGYRAVGEASTSYLWAAGTPERILDKSPQARIVVILRDPVARAYSHYLMDVRAGRQSLPFYEALLEDYGRERKGWHISNLYVELGLYYQQLAAYWAAFGPDRVLILLFDELSTAPLATLDRLAQFLGIERRYFETADAHTAHNPYLAPTRSLQAVKRSPLLQKTVRAVLPLSMRATIRNRFFMRQTTKPPMDDRAVRFLGEIYRPEIEALEAFLGHEMPSLRGAWWNA